MHPSNIYFESLCALFLYIRVAVAQTEISPLSCSRQWPEMSSFHKGLFPDIYEKNIQFETSAVVHVKPVLRACYTCV